MAITDVPTTDLDNFRLAFTDDFLVDVPLGQFPSKVSDRWRVYTGTDTSGQGKYAPDKVVSVSGGILTKRLHLENRVPLGAAILPKVPGSSKYGTKYGRYSVRFRSDSLERGWRMAWLLWPDSGTNTSGSASGVGGNGEIDWPEKNMDSPNVWAYVHHQDSTSSSDQAWFKSVTDVRQWHVYTMEWSPNLVIILLDGVEIGRTTVKIPNTSMHWSLQTETWFIKELPTQALTVEIDWVAAWAYDTTAHAPGDPPPPPPPPPPPTRFTNLVAPATATGTVTLGIESSPGTVQAKWVVDDVQVGWDGSAPFEKLWDSTKVANGVHRIYAKSSDSVGWTQSAVGSITVSN